MNLPRLLRSVFIAAQAVMLCSCATVTSGPFQRVTVVSDPMGANVSINNEPRGKTPVTVSLSRWGSHTVRIELPGYLPSERKLQKDINGWVWGNILIGGVAGVVIDTASGAIFELPESVYMRLLRDGPAKSQNEDFGFFQSGTNADEQSFVVLAVSKADPTWRKVGMLEKLRS